MQLFTGREEWWSIFWNVEQVRKDTQFLYVTLLFLCTLEVNVDNSVSGSPLTQVLVYALLFKCSTAIDFETIQLLINTPLNVKVACRKTFSSPIELAINLKRLDIAKLLVRSGAHPVDPCIPTGKEFSGIIQLLKEYYEFNTNYYIKWLLHEHLLSHDLPEFIETVLSLNILNKTTMEMFARVMRHPAHAILTSWHEEMTRKFVEFYGSDILSSKDEDGKTALQIAVEKGDIESVLILVDM